MNRKAIEFFENEIKELEIVLNGVLREEYKNFIRNKKIYYESALKALREQDAYADDGK